MLSRLLVGCALLLALVPFVPTASADTCAAVDPTVEEVVCTVYYVAYTPIAWGNCIGSEWKDVGHDVACVRGK